MNSFVPYVLLWVAMVYALTVSYWLVLPLAILAAGFLARIFIIFHDCGHGSFFQSKRANQIIGSIAGLLNLTPYRHWRWQHALHHGTSGDLDRRGSGDIWTLTVQEYLESNRWKRVAYRLARNPLVLFMIAPLYVFVVHHRFASATAPPRERQSVRRMNLALLAVTVLMSIVMGLRAFLLAREEFRHCRQQAFDRTMTPLNTKGFRKIPEVLAETYLATNREFSPSTQSTKYPEYQKASGTDSSMTLLRRKQAPTAGPQDVPTRGLLRPTSFHRALRQRP